MRSKGKYHKLPLHVSLAIRYLHQTQKEPLSRLLEMFPQYKKTTLHRHSKLPLSLTEPIDNRCNAKRGRPSKLNDRDKRKLVSALHKLRRTEGNFASTDIQREAGFGEEAVSNRTVRRALNSLGYRFTQCRRKGQLLDEDLTKRLKFAKKCRRLPTNFWQDGISFYLDGTSWVHKTNPSQHARTCRTRTWKKRGESLAQHCTAKGKKEGSGGSVAKFMVAIAYGRGVIKCERYSGSVNGELCADFVRRNFPGMFTASNNTKGRLFLQDGDPSQNSALAKDAMEDVGCRLFRIPPRSPDLNPIENVFHLIGKQLKRDAIRNNLTRETFDEFCNRVKRTVMRFPQETIDRTISSMPRRVALVIKNKGLRTKY